MYVSAQLKLNSEQACRIVDCRLSQRMHRQIVFDIIWQQFCIPIFERISIEYMNGAHDNYNRTHHWHSYIVHINGIWSMDEANGNVCKKRQGKNENETITSNDTIIAKVQRMCSPTTKQQQRAAWYAMYDGECLRRRGKGSWFICVRGA